MVFYHGLHEARGGGGDDGKNIYFRTSSGGGASKICKGEFYK